MHRPAYACFDKRSDKGRSQAPGSASAFEYEPVRVGPLAFQFLFDAVQNSVDELRRFLRAESSCDLDGLIDDDSFRRSVVVQEFLSGKPKQVAIDDSHSIQPPVFGVTLNQS